MSGHVLGGTATAGPATTTLNLHTSLANFGADATLNGLRNIHTFHGLLKSEIKVVESAFYFSTFQRSKLNLR